MSGPPLYRVVVRKHDNGGTEYLCQKSVVKPGEPRAEMRTRWVYSQAMADRFTTSAQARDALRAVAVEQNVYDAKIRVVVARTPSAGKGEMVRK